MLAQLTQTNKKSNFTPAAEPSISRKSEDDALQEEHPQTDAALQMKSIFSVSNGGTPPGSGDGENTLHNSKLLDYLKVQPKLTIGQSNDKYEQEADQEADLIMHMPEQQDNEILRVSGKTKNTQIQRRCAESKGEESAFSSSFIEGKTQIKSLDVQRGSTQYNNISGADTERLMNVSKSSIAQKRGENEEITSSAPNANSRNMNTLQTPGKPRCTTIGTRLTTRKVGNAPLAWYGANFNHTFHPLKTGCTLKGVEVSEVVSVNRDDFQSGAKNIPVGKTIWKLTSRHELHKPDSIYTQAGQKGIGVNPVSHWPAVLAQDQLWYYRFSSNGSWRLGPGIGIRVTLSGKMNKKNSLKVTTTDNGKSRVESYRGPNIRLKRKIP
jgi:hypothetical protein